jgi:hypothetical protein
VGDTERCSLFFAGKERMKYLQKVSEQKLEVSTVRILYEIMLSCKGEKPDYKFPVEAGFVYDEVHAIAAVLT